MMFTRDDYMNQRCTHDDYYGQFDCPQVRDSVLRTIGLNRIIASTDEHFNDIRLTLWDSVQLPSETLRALASANGTRGYYSQSETVCIAKAVARKIRTEHNNRNERFINHTISEGTLRSEDLILAFLHTYHNMDKPVVNEDLVQRANAVLSEDETEEHDKLALLEELMEAIESLLPDNCYVGTLEGDGACFGIWENNNEKE